VSSQDGIQAITLSGSGLYLPLPTEGQWRLLHTKSRQEKVLADELKRVGIDHFLPLVAEDRLYGKRRFKVEVPLFPGYLFIRGSKEGAYTADRTRRVARIIEVMDQARLDWELQNLHVALRNQASMRLYPFLKEGMRVEVKSGQLRGLQGLIEKRSPSGRLILQVEMLGRALALEISGALLTPL
jgi:transcription antitermination factor NusG